MRNGLGERGSSPTAPLNDLECCETDEKNVRIVYISYSSNRSIYVSLLYNLFTLPKQHFYILKSICHFAPKTFESTKITPKQATTLVTHSPIQNCSRDIPNIDPRYSKMQARATASKIPQLTDLFQQQRAIPRRQQSSTPQPQAPSQQPDPTSPSPPRYACPRP